MYEEFFELMQTPFTRDIPADRLYSSRQIEDAIGRLTYVADRQLFAVVTADPGCGKSTLIRMFESRLPKDKYMLLYLSDSKLTPRWFYKGMLDQLGIESKFYRGDAKRQLQKEVEIIRGVQGKKVVCILDEAHLLEKETIEEFRFLLNYRFDSMSPMALVLVGQTELWEKLRLQRYAAVRQRIDINCILPHLDRAETEVYIHSHLDYAGGRTEIFTDKAVDEIFKESTGIPRRINRICDSCLMYASQQGKRLTENRRQKTQTRHDEIWGLLNDYADIRDELEDALLSFQVLHAEIEFAMQDITSELTALNEHLHACDSRLIRFRNPDKSHYEVIKEQCELPFTKET